MSSKWKPGIIQDPVYGYIPFTSLERVVLDQQLTQRLRHVAQNGLAHYVFPEVRTSRFTHSLGVMHLASVFLLSAFRNSPDNSDVSKELHDWVREKEPMINLSTLSEPLSDRALIADQATVEHYKPAVRIAEQALRLAALFHDLGHFPFSHDFEDGLKKYHARLLDSGDTNSSLDAFFNSLAGMKLHERLGHDLAWLLLQRLTSVLDPPFQTAAKLSFECAFDILESLPKDPYLTKGCPHQSVVEWLHTLIDGELDVDRADFVLRDGRSYGLGFPSFDVSRLSDGVVVVHDDDRGFETVVTPSARPALESFFLARYRIYQIGIRHHKVSLYGAALREAIAYTLSEGGPEVDKFLDDLGNVAALAKSKVVPEEPERDRLLIQFSEYDDIWWFTCMRRTRQRGPANPWLDAVCTRGQGPLSLWKRLEDFPIPSDEILCWNRALPPHDDAEAMGQWPNIEKELLGQGVLVQRHRFSPWSPDPNDQLNSWFRVQEGHALTPITRLSPIVASLRETWEKDLQIHAFKESDEIAINAGDITAQLDFREGKNG